MERPGRKTFANADQAAMAKPSIKLLSSVVSLEQAGDCRFRFTAICTREQPPGRCPTCSSNSTHCLETEIPVKPKTPNARATRCLPLAGGCELHPITFVLPGCIHHEDLMIDRCDNILPVLRVNAADNMLGSFKPDRDGR